MTGPTDPDAHELLRRWTGDTAPVRLGAGMEGVVYALDDDRVAKVWFAGRPERLSRLQAALAALAHVGLPWATPRIDEIANVRGSTVTVERRLTGMTLAAAMTSGVITRDDALRRFVDVVAALATRASLPAFRDLPVLDEEHPLCEGVPDFADALSQLVDRRAARFHDVLAAAVPDLDRVLTALRRRLPEVDSGRRSVVHGDLFPGNVLVDDAAQPTAVLDWGFLSTEGDPVFDAGVAAALFDMYGDDALTTELALYDALRERLGYDHAAMRVYRAAYSVVTANAYSAGGDDGHFRWCVTALQRPDVVAALAG